MSKSFSLGFTGATLDHVLPWMDEQVGHAPNVVVSMAGSGKDIAHLARAGRTIRSWDTQYLSRCVVEGVFAAPAELPPPVERGEADGYATSAPTIRNLPLGAAVLADWIAVQGSDYDRACLAKALIRSTYMGRLGTWARAADADTLWEGYLRAHQTLAAWRGLPGTFLHTHGSVFAEPALEAQLTDAVLVIDTPKVLQGGAKGDIYSQGWNGLNSILAQQEQTLPPWTEVTFREDMPQLWCAPYRRMLLFHTSGARPDPAHVVAAMTADGVTGLSDYQTWEHKGRVDMCWVVDRGVEQLPLYNLEVPA